MMQFRGFRMTRTRLLLHLQADIEKLETELQRLDQAQAGEKRLRSWRTDVAKCQKEKRQSIRCREDIMEELRVKICQYGGYSAE
jgi:hypothetical protein